MKVSRSRLFLLLGLCAAACAAAEDGALTAIDACRARLDPRTDVGIERVQRRCPELLPALDNFSDETERRAVAGALFARLNVAPRLELAH